MFSMFKNLVGSKTLTKEDLKPALEKMKDHVIGMLQCIKIRVMMFNATFNSISVISWWALSSIFVHRCIMSILDGIKL